MEKFLCSACGTMYISEDGETWQIPIEKYGPAEISAKPGERADSQRNPENVP
jgi:hypothetical protein